MHPPAHLITLPSARIDFPANRPVHCRNSSGANVSALRRTKCYVKLAQNVPTPASTGTPKTSARTPAVRAVKHSLRPRPSLMLAVAGLHLIHRLTTTATSEEHTPELLSRG